MIEEGTQAYRAVCNGDADAARAIVKSHNPGLMTIARAMGLADDLALDVVQMVWLRFFEHAKGVGEGVQQPLRDPSALRFWLATTCRNLVRDEYRRRKSESAVALRKLAEDEALGVLIDDTDMAGALISAERNDAVRLALARLSEPCRELIALLAVEPKYTYEEIAEILGRPLGSIGPTRDRCLTRLRSLLMGAGHE